MAIGVDPNVFFFPDGDLGQDVLIVVPRDPEIPDRIIGFGVVFLNVGFEGDVQPLGIDQEIEPYLVISADHLSGSFFEKFKSKSVPIGWGGKNWQWG